MKENIKEQVVIWAEKKGITLTDIQFDLFSNRDIFQEKIIEMTQNFLGEAVLSEKDIYIISAIVGEIGNNSFDHNIGNWPMERGIIFGYISNEDGLQIFIADNGQGILKTLKSVRPNLENDEQALKVAFTEVVSGRAPEARGNGLKFVRQNITDCGMNLLFVSGNAEVVLNGGMKIGSVFEKYQGCLAILTFKNK
jgi:hypothetical protein